MTTKTIINAGIRFHCTNEIEAERARTLFMKEPGTIEWLNRMQPEDTLIDVGANVGCYSLYAAVKRGASVIAVEPHVGTAATLLRNVAENKADVKVFTCALASGRKIQPFHYGAFLSGSSGSQVMIARAQGVAFDAVAVECKQTLTLDEISQGKQRVFLKIDVDGSEADILRGGLNTLHRAISVQVEVGPHNRKLVDFITEECCLTPAGYHLTAHGQRLLDSGTPLQEITHNVIYERN